MRGFPVANLNVPTPVTTCFRNSNSEPQVLKRGTAWPICAYSIFLHVLMLRLSVRRSLRYVYTSLILGHLLIYMEQGGRWYPSCMWITSLIRNLEIFLVPLSYCVRFGISQLKTTWRISSKIVSWLERQGSKLRMSCITLMFEGTIRRGSRKLQRLRGPGATALGSDNVKWDNAYNAC